MIDDDQPGVYRSEHSFALRRSWDFFRPKPPRVAMIAVLQRMFEAPASFS